MPVGLDHYPISASHMTGMTGTHHHAQLLFLVEMGVKNYLPELALNYNPLNLCLLSS
jgi:hypothetical protein